MIENLQTETDKRYQKRFLWGVLLAWIPTVPLIVSLLRGFKDLSSSKAIGLGALAGGLAESYLTLGVCLTLIFEVAAIILLFRVLSRGHLIRSLVSVISICCSVATLSLFGLLLWLFSKMPH